MLSWDNEHGDRPSYGFTRGVALGLAATLPFWVGVVYRAVKALKLA